MSPEQYSVALDLEVTENAYNMEQGNVYLTAHFIPCDQNKVGKIYKRMGIYDYKGRLNMYFKEITRVVPFARRILWLYSSDLVKDSQLIKIPITADLNIAESPLCRIELQLSNKMLQFKEATLRFNLILNPYSLTSGYRYYMREWFWTCLVLATSILTSVNFVVIFIVLFLFGCLPCISSGKKQSKQD